MVLSGCIVYGVEEISEFQSMVYFGFSRHASNLKITKQLTFPAPWVGHVGNFRSYMHGLISL